MEQVLQGSAKTTYAIRGELQRLEDKSRKASISSRPNRLSRSGSHHHQRDLAAYWI